jgi:hypothetical protein
MVHAGLCRSGASTKRRCSRRKSSGARALRLPRFPRQHVRQQAERWDDALAGWDRLRVIVNAMTRMRFCSPTARMEFHRNGNEPPAGYRPGIDGAAGRQDRVFGHWSALGLQLNERAAGPRHRLRLGRPLSALRLEDRWLVQVPSRATKKRETRDERLRVLQDRGGQIPSTRVFEDEHTLAFMDLGQVNPGHVLVAVKKHAENLYALDERRRQRSRAHARARAHP